MFKNIGYVKVPSTSSLCKRAGLLLTQRVVLSSKVIQKSSIIGPSAGSQKLVVCITAMINHVFISFSAVQIYDL